MTKKIKNKLLVLSMLLFAFTPLAFVAGVSAQNATPTQSICKGANDLEFDSSNQSGQCEDAEAEGEDRVNAIIRAVINIFSVIVGIVAVIMIIYGGFKYITSGGSSERITSAKNTLLYAIIGLIIVALAQIIVRFVLGTAAGAE